LTSTGTEMTAEEHVATAETHLRYAEGHLQPTEEHMADAEVHLKLVKAHLAALEAMEPPETGTCETTTLQPPKGTRTSPEENPTRTASGTAGAKGSCRRDRRTCGASLCSASIRSHQESARERDEDHASGSDTIGLLPECH
jgi:hypothetical protein